MRLLLDANVLLDCLVSEKDGSPRTGKDAISRILDLCDQGVLLGLIAWHTLPIISYYYRCQHSAEETAVLMNDLLAIVEIPTTGHTDAISWQTHGIPDFEDALQLVSAIAGGAEMIISRNLDDFANSPIPVFLPESFLVSHLLV